MKPSILLLDTDTHTLEQLQNVLQRDNYPVLVAVDGHAGLRLARSEKPALIVSELLLAGLDGYKVWELLRSDVTTAHIPILVTSALNVPPPRQPYQLTNGEWQTLNYDEYLPKPLDLRRFMQVVHKRVNSAPQMEVADGPSIILMLEESTLRDQLCQLLQTHHFGLEIVTSLTEAQRLIRTLPPAALILDYRQPNEEVEILVRQARKFVPHTAIMLIAQPENLKPELVDIYDDLIRLPFEAHHTLKVITNVLEIHSHRQRSQLLTKQLITTSQNLLESQQALQAQNEELQQVNDQLRELDNLKEHFISMVVHDLKSPLSAILGALNFTLIDPRINLTDKNIAMLNGAIGAGNQMLRLIETLLEDQRLKDGRSELDLEPFDFPALVNDSLERIVPLLTLHQIEINQQMPENLPAIYADAHLSQRVLENLLDNAIKFSPRNTTITIQATVTKPFVTICVVDQGPGIPKAQQAEIFNRFARLKQTKSSSRSSFGLGLAFCKQAIETMDGQIWVESDGQTGTTFNFTLPIYDDERINRAN